MTGFPVTDLRICLCVDLSMEAMTEIIYGIKPVLSALKADPSCVKEILVSRKMSDPQTAKLILEAKKNRIKYVNVPRKALTKQAGTDKHQGVIAIIETYRYASLESILGSRDSSTIPVVVALDEIQDPRNLGAIIRCVNVFGAQGVILPKDRSVSVSSTVAKASAGALSFTPVVKVVNLVNALQKLKEEGYWILGLDPGGEQNIYDLDLTSPLVIVVGNEGRGMRRLVKKECDFLAKIPMVGEIGSLNASAAAAVTLFEVFRQRIAGQATRE